MAHAPLIIDVTHLSLGEIAELLPIQVKWMDDGTVKAHIGWVDLTQYQDQDGTSNLIRFYGREEHKR